jgi:FixJ family two-component response regulator
MFVGGMLRTVASEVIPIIAAVDDDFRIRESIASLLESAGYAPVVFSSGEEFLGSGSLAAATCVITDIRMPGMDGIELQRRIRLQRPGLPVILISGHYDAQVRQKAFDEGAVDVLYKPFDAVDLLKIIQTALTKSA